MKKYIIFMLFCYSCLSSQDLRRYDPRWNIDDNNSFDCQYNIVPEPSTYIQTGILAGMGTVIWLLKKNKKRS